MPPFRPALLGALAAGAPMLAEAHRYEIGRLEIEHPVIEAASRDSGSTCAHVTLTNSGDRPDRLLGVTIEAARETRIARRDGAGAFVPVEDGVELPSGAEVRLRRPDWCLLMTGLTTSFEADLGVYPAVLLFESAGPVAIEFLVHEGDGPHRH